MEEVDGRSPEESGLSREDGPTAAASAAAVPATSGARRVIDRPVVRVLLLFALLFAIGLVTRAPAWQFPHIYALHGVLAAPFCAALAQWHFRRRGSVPQLSVATLLLAALLGAMSPAMGLGFAAVAALTALAWPLLGRLSAGGRRLACAVIFGALDYPCALAVGLALGMYAPSPDALPLIAVLVLLSAALAFFGALVTAALLDRRKNR